MNAAVLSRLPTVSAVQILAQINFTEGSFVFRFNMELLIGQHMEKGESSSSSAATVVAGASLPVADHKKDNGSSILTKDQRIEKVSLNHPTGQADDGLDFLLN